MGSYKMFGIFNRKFKTEETGPPEDVVNAFTKYSDGGKEMSADQLLRFLVEFQGQADCTLSHAQDIMKQLHHLSDPNFLSINDFCYFLVNEQLNPPISHQVVFLTCTLIVCLYIVMFRYQFKTDNIVLFVFLFKFVYDVCCPLFIWNVEVFN